MALNFIIWLFLSLILFLFFICIFYKKITKKKGIGYERYLELFDIGEIKKEVKKFKSQKTILTFNFLYCDSNNYFEIIKSDFFEPVEIKNKFHSFEIKIDNEDEKNESFIIRKIELIKNNTKIDFIIEIYINQNNNYYIIADIKDVQTYSLETILYSPKKENIPNNFILNNENLILDDFNFEDRKRIFIFNMEKDILNDFIKKITDLNINNYNKIFETKNNNFFLNIRINENGIKESSLFLNENNEKSFDLSESDKKILINFEKKIIKTFIIPNINKNNLNINKEIKLKFLNEIENFTIDISKNEEKNYETKEIEEIPLLKDKSINEINEIIEEKEYLNKKEIKKNDKYIGYIILGTLINNFFKTTFNKRFINEPNENEMKFTILLCQLSLALNAKYPFESLIKYNIKIKEILKLNFSNKDKLKIACCLKSHYINEHPTKLEVKKIYDLEEFSPYIKGELMFRKMIKNLNEKSLLKFIFIQLNSGSGYDFINLDDCYKIKMIPLIDIKNHLLNKRDNYFFIYANVKTDEVAYIDPYTKLESINEIFLLGNDFNEDNSIKVFLLQIHEEGGHLKYTGKDTSPKIYNK